MARSTSTIAVSWAERADPTWRERLRGAAFIARRHPNMAVGLFIVLLAASCAIFADVLFTSDPSQPDPFVRFTPPGSEYWFGTDNIGRDIFSRTIYGARISLIVSVSVASIAIGTGALIGMLAGYYPRFDMIVMRFMDGLMSIPGIILAIALMAIMSGSVQSVIIALSITESPVATRVVRSAVLGIREQAYIEASRAIGANPPRIIFRHILPNIIAPLIVHATFVMSAAVLLEAYLSFLGAGPPEEVPSWGNIMAGAQNFLTRASWIIIFPGIFLTLTVMGISLAGDGLRDILDPKLKRRL